MNKLKCIIVDDEESCVSILEKMILLKLGNQCEIMGTYTNPLEALKAINKNKPDILFADIEMPHLSGLELVNLLDEHEIEVVFTTAYKDYAIDAIKLSVTDYLLKPFSIQELQIAIERCKERMIIKKRPVLNASTKVKVIGNNGELYFINSEEIIYIQASSNYSIIHMENGMTYTVAKTLKDFEELLINYSFIRTHHSYLVNIKYVSSFVGGIDDELVLKNGIRISVSRRRKSSVLEIIEKS